MPTKKPAKRKPATKRKPAAKRKLPRAKTMRVTTETPGIHVGDAWYPKGSLEHARAKRKVKHYVGVSGSPGDRQREVFTSSHTPTQRSHSEYRYVIGPFRSSRGAHFMAEYGGGNPHLQTAGDAERLAKKHGYKAPKTILYPKARKAKGVDNCPECGYSDTAAGAKDGCRTCKSYFCER